MMGAAIATLAAYLALFIGVWLRARSVYPVPYQWRRVITISVAAVGLTLAARAFDTLPAAIVAIVLFPLVLVPLRFYQPAERSRILALARRKGGSRRPPAPSSG
jgi:tellurite resistance protein TehA-like permease